MHLLFALALLLSSFQDSWLTLPAVLRDLYGTQAPDFHASSVDGVDYRLSAFRGRYVLLDFWGIGCAPCRDALPALEAINHDYKDRGLVILGVDIADDRPTLETFLKTTPAPYPTVLDTDSAVSKLFHVNVVPTFLLIDPDGKIADGQVGFLKAGPGGENVGESQLRGMLRRRVGSDPGK